MSASNAIKFVDDKLYLDFNATTPLEPSVLEKIHSTLKDAWGNPSSDNNSGIAAREIIKKARESVAAMINGTSKDIVFASGGTEINNWVIQSAISHFHTCRRLGLMCQEDNEYIFKLARSLKSARPHIITTGVEHDSINMCLGQLSDDNKILVTWLNTDKETGLIKTEELLAAIKPSTCLISIMLANNETGNIQPLKEMAQVLKKYNEDSTATHLFPVLLHTDASQAIGKIPIDVEDLGVDYMTIVGHKFYGPRVGALYVRNLDKDIPLYPLFYGGGQERNFRPGTENTGMIAGLGEAANLVTQNILQYQENMKKIRDYFETRLKKEFGDKIVFNGVYSDETIRIPNTSNFSFVGDKLKGYKVLKACKKFVASVGAACHGYKRPSTILLAMQIPEEVAANAIRISFGRNNTKADVDTMIKDLLQAVKVVEAEAEAKE